MKYTHLVESHTRGVLQRMAEQFLVPGAPANEEESSR
jgi:hypothetical protein